MLEAAGVIRLREGAGITATKRDIVEKPENLKIEEIEADQLPVQLPDLDYAIINSNYAISAELNPVADSLLIGLPLGIPLVAGEEKGVLPRPRSVMRMLNVVINLLRSVPFQILMILVVPLTRLIVGKSYGSMASIVPLVQVFQSIGTHLAVKLDKRIR